MENRNLHELAANPEGSLSRKINNLWVNYRKALAKRKADAQAKGETLADDEDGSGLGTVKTNGKRGSRKAGTPGAALRRKKAPKGRGRGKTQPKTVETEDGEDEAASSGAEVDDKEMLYDTASQDLLYRNTRSKNRRHTTAPKGRTAHKHDAESEDYDAGSDDDVEDGGA
ncbi:hypothetical protein LTR36_003807 [Oleoguttula mirabilis]|uniref:Uncharacterized protein n=1 Tax=Oleoguttula mirabilis TaxID=1507867 RepID=A0AAV9JJ35_9PEZI|nr:hypothetical protein LTR36_003807 [Oleoguttula mirabilis]